MLLKLLIVVLPIIDCHLALVIKPTNESSQDEFSVQNPPIDNMSLRLLTKNIQTNCTKCRIKTSEKLKNLQVNNQVQLNKFPWMLDVLENNTLRFGATLIHPKMAMTVAHYLSPHSVYTVRAGEWNWDNPNSHHERLTEKIIMHPNYLPQSLINDIGLLLLKSPFNLTPHVQTICLPNPSVAYNATNCLVTGWGDDSETKDKFQRVLRRIKVSVLSYETCKRKLRSTKLGPRFFVHDSYICGQKNELQDTNKGDGGGALICPNIENQDSYQQVGIVSWGLRNRTKDIPGVYTNVVIFIDWIFSVMRSYGLKNGV